jgi:hypothetical protein
MKLDKFNSEYLLPKADHKVIENLPSFIKQSCLIFSDEVEQEVFFYSTLGVLSGCLPNYIGNYDGKWVSANLYLFVLGPYGTGKGTMTYARYFGNEIHRRKRERYITAMVEYNRNRRRPGRPRAEDSTQGDGNSTDTVPPPNEMFFLPADTSKSALLEAMSHNQLTAVIFETESETLNAALKQDFGGFNDVLLKAFHHEPITLMRKQEKVYSEILNPNLSVVLSSTYDQFLSLVKSAESGLVSRFMFYLLPEINTFRNVFDGSKENLKPYFEKLGLVTEQRFQYLAGLEKPITFIFTEEQQIAFHDYFVNMKSSNPGLGGIVNRLALSTYRISMILSYWREIDDLSGLDPKEYIVCSNIDFTNSLAIAQIMLDNSSIISNMLPKPKGVKPGNIEELYLKLPDEFKTKEALELAESLLIKRRTCERFLSEDPRLESNGTGKYKKQ